MPATHLQLGTTVIVSVPDSQQDAIRPVMHDFIGTLEVINPDGTVDVLDEEDELFDSIPSGCVRCQACDGRGWRAFSCETLPAVIQRCDLCKAYDSDLDAARASGLKHTIRNRETGEPCEATAESPWEAALDHPEPLPRPPNHHRRSR